MLPRSLLLLLWMGCLCFLWIFSRERTTFVFSIFVIRFVLQLHCVSHQNPVHLGRHLVD